MSPQQTEMVPEKAAAVVERRQISK